MNTRKYLSKPARYIAYALIGLGTLTYVSLQCRETELNKLEHKVSEPARPDHLNISSIGFPDARNGS